MYISSLCLPCLRGLGIPLDSLGLNLGRELRLLDIPNQVPKGCGNGVVDHLLAVIRRDRLAPSGGGSVRQSLNQLFRGAAGAEFENEGLWNSCAVLSFARLRGVPVRFKLLAEKALRVFSVLRRTWTGCTTVSL